MFRSLTLMLRASTRAPAEQAQQAIALPLLREEIAAAARDLDKTRRATALLSAQATRERQRLAEAQARHQDLEGRTIAALKAEEEALAREAAATLLHLEQDIGALQHSVGVYAHEEARLRALLLEGESRLRALERGVRVAQARALGGQLQGRIAPATTGLEGAEQRLRALQEHQEMEQASQAAMHALTQEGQAEAVRDKLAGAGFGAPTRPDVDSVLARLKAKATA